MNQFAQTILDKARAAYQQAEMLEPMLVPTIMQIILLCEEEIQKEDTMGGKPSQGTPADKRLSANKPKTLAAKATTAKPAPKKTGK